jgi:copper chaperone CopZ
MKSVVSLALATFLLVNTSFAQISNAVTTNVKIAGNCGMCKTAIEKAADKKKISTAIWNEEGKTATITYDSKKTNLDAVLKDIALAGYDNQSFLAPDDAYSKLPECCKYKRESKQPVAAPLQQAERSSHQNHEAHQQNKEDNTIQTANQLNAVFDSYFTLKDALVKTDGNQASLKAKELKAAITAVQMDKLSMDVHTVWMKLVNGLTEDAEHINETKDIAHQRDHFMSLSKNMYELIKVAKTNDAVYYQFCPMANNGKGANWLSKEAGIKNPYYGAQMLTCGKTVETIKQ